MRAHRAVIALSILAFLTLAYIFFPESIDDAYITLRFSNNMALGYGPIFNIGEKVEGYSNFSWMVLLAFVGWAGIPMEMAMKFLGLFSGLGVLLFVWKISACRFKSGLAVVAPLLLLGTGSFFALWAVDGLETMFYTMLLTSLVYALASKNTNTLLIGLIAGLVALTRPEGILFSLIAVSFLSFNNGLRSGLKALGLVAFFAGGYELFRIFYFGEFVSNTALAKVHMGVNTALNGLRYLYTYNADSGFFLLPVAFAGAIASKKDPKLLIPIVFILAQVVFLMVSGGDFMYGYRFMIPVVPCIVLLCAYAIEAVNIRVNLTAALLLLILTVTTQSYYQYAHLPAKHVGFDNLTFRTSPLFNVAAFLDQRSGPDDWILLSEAGVIPFYVEAKILDYMGLVTPFNAVYNQNGRLNSDYLFSFRPKFVVISFVETNDNLIYPRMGRDVEILNNPKFSAYKHVQNFEIPNGLSFLNTIYYKVLPVTNRYPRQGIKRIFFAVFERESGTEPHADIAP